MKVFAPLIRHPSAICVAVVRIAMASEPASGSVMARQPISEPSQSAGRNLRFCSSEPCRTNRPFTRSAWWSKVAAEDMQTAPSSSPGQAELHEPEPRTAVLLRHAQSEDAQLGPFLPRLSWKAAFSVQVPSSGRHLVLGEVAQHVAEHLLFRCQVDDVCRTCKHACLPSVWPGPACGDVACLRGYIQPC